MKKMIMLSSLFKTCYENKDINSTCKYCIKFYEGKLAKQGSLYQKECLAAKKNVLITDKCCNFFTLNNIFYCLKYNHRITFEECDNRNQKKYLIFFKCRNCRQYQKEIVYIMPRFIRKKAYSFMEKIFLKMPKPRRLKELKRILFLLKPKRSIMKMKGKR